jgi:hypothetical protein
MKIGGWIGEEEARSSFVRLKLAGFADATSSLHLIFFLVVIFELGPGAHNLGNLIPSVSRSLQIF